MNKKLKRLLFQIPIVPLFIVYCIFSPIHWISEKVVDFCAWTSYGYGVWLRKRFPKLIVKKEYIR